MSDLREPRSSDEDVVNFLSSFTVFSKFADVANALSIYITQFFSWFSLPFLRYNFGFQAYSWIMILANCLLIWFVYHLSTKGFGFAETARGRPIDPAKLKVLSIFFSYHLIIYFIVAVLHQWIIKVRWWNNPLKKENLWHGWCFGCSIIYFFLYQLGIGGKVVVEEFPVGKFPITINENLITRYVEPALVFFIGFIFSKLFFSYGMLWMISGVSLFMFESLREKNTKFAIQNLVNSRVMAMVQSEMMEEAKEPKQPRQKKIKSSLDRNGLNFDLGIIPKSNLGDDELNPTPT